MSRLKTTLWMSSPSLGDKMIKVKCHSNIDDFRPTVNTMEGMPRVGEYVECLWEGRKTEFIIVRVTHCQDGRTEGMRFNDCYVKVELTNKIYEGL